MRLPTTIDRLRRGSGPAVDDDEWEYVEVDGDGLSDDDGWEYVVVDDDGSTSDATAPAPRGARDRRAAGGWRGAARSWARVALGTGADTDVADDDDRWLTDGTELAGDDGWDDDGDDDLEGVDDLDGLAGFEVDPRIAARRDSIAVARRTRLRRRAVAVAVVLGIVLALGAVTRSAALDVDSIQVTGSEQSDPATLAAATGIAVGAPLLGLDLDAATVALRAEPWVLDATVERSWSGAISVSVVERRPVATINAGEGGWLLVDQHRRIVAASLAPPDLPIVDGIGAGSVGDELDGRAQAGLDVAAALTPGVRSRVAYVDGTDPDAVELVLQPSGTVLFGPATAIDTRIRTLQTIFAQVDLVCVATIDLQVPDEAVLTRVPACA